jgi:hypothetical protein
MLYPVGTLMLAWGVANISKKDDIQYLKHIDKNCAPEFVIILQTKVHGKYCNIIAEVITTSGARGWHFMRNIDAI